MSTYKSTHTGERVDNAVTKIPESLPTEDSLIVVKANGSASEYVPRSQVSSDKLDKQTAQTTSDQIYGKLADGSQTMFDLTMGAEPTTIPRRDTAGRIQVADGVSGNDAVNFNQLSAVEASVINSLDKGHIAYVNKENTFTEQQRIVTPYDSDINTQEEGFIDAGIINVSRIKYTDNTKQYYTDNDAILNARYLQLKQQIKNESGLTQHIIQLDHAGIKQVDYDNNSNTNYGYILPKTYPNQNVTLATIEDLTAQLDTKFDKAGGTVTGDMVVGGNFTVQGRTTTVDSETLRVTDKLIEVGKGNTAPLTSPAGLYTPKYDGQNNGGIVYDNTGTAYVGDIVLDENGNVDVAKSNLQPIATRENAASFEDKHLPVWDKQNQRFTDSGYTPDNYITSQSESADKYYAQITNENGIISARIFKNGEADVQNLIISKDGVKVLGKNVANTEQVDGKVDKLAASLINQAYVRNANGEDSGLAYTYTDEGGTLAVRNASGQLQVSDPSQGKDATNKSYADNLNARYVSTSILGG